MKRKKRISVRNREKGRKREKRPKQSKRTKQQKDKVIGLTWREIVTVWLLYELQYSLTVCHVKKERG